jgi:uncharacterized protein
MPVQIAIDHERITQFCRKWKVKELALFGSVLREDFGPQSDVDVLFTAEEDSGIGLFEHVRMIEELKSIFGRDVDLVSKTAIRNPYRRRDILANTLTIYDSSKE